MSYMTNRLKDINKFGQKIWLDNISRDLILSNKLYKMILDDGIAGVTSNPTIFHKAISNDKFYHDDLAKLKQSNLTLEQRYEQLVIPDIIKACDIFSVIYNNTHREDGYVSFEVSPHLANNTGGTIDNAIRLWQEIDRPNLMIKVPATKAGIAALEELIYRGLNVNITLLFSIEQVVDTWRAYIRGLQRRIKNKLPINQIKAVASLFLSRVDTLADNKIPQELQGKTAINLAKMAYLVYQEIFTNKEFVELEKHGAKRQYLLFASTGTKNPAYSDVMYIEKLIGNETINTVPDITLAAFKDHGHAEQTLSKNILNSSKIIEEIKQHINLHQIGETLQLEGLQSFEKSFDALIKLMK